jgi:hypothetical protein
MVCVDADFFQIVVFSRNAKAFLGIGDTRAFRRSVAEENSLNCAMPELLNISVGSSLSTIGAEGTIRWPLLWKKSRNCFLMSCDFMLGIGFRVLDSGFASGSFEFFFDLKP